MEQLAGKVAVVTGGSRGIGAAVALRLAAEGASVALTYARAASRALSVVREIESRGRRALPIQADNASATAVPDAVERAVRELGRIDILVNNAGTFPRGMVDDVTAEDLDKALAVHVRAVFLASQAAARHMGEGGRIISIGSCIAERVPVPGVALYAMTKSALTGLTRGLARDLGPRGITVTVVHP